jgi:hypothetical protein
MYKTKNHKFTSAFACAVLGFVYLLEYIIVVYFNAYSYSPKIVSDPFQDTVFGNMFSQISITTTAVLLIIMDISFGWYFLFASVYFFIEVLFIWLGIYHHYWYHSIYTPVVLVPLFWLMKNWYFRVARSTHGLASYLALFFSSGALSSNLLILPLKLLNIQIFKGNLFTDLSRDHTAVNFIFICCLVNLLICLHRWKAHWAWKAMAFGILFIAMYLLNVIRILNVRDGWFCAVALFDLFGCYGIVLLMDRFLIQNDPL